MNENNELNDIILNKGSSANSNKKIILAVATLGVILIIVVMLMNSLTSSGIDNLPKASLPPQPQTELVSETTQEPLFEDVEVEQEDNAPETNLEEIAQKLKKESGINDEDAEVATPPVAAAPEVKKEPLKQASPVVAKQPVKKQTVAAKPVAAPKPATKPVAKVDTNAGGTYYIQVGSFSKYEPNKKFINSITDLGYNYKYQQANNINKVLVGPFKTEAAAKEARRVLRAKVEPGAFLINL